MMRRVRLTQDKETEKKVRKIRMNMERSAAIAGIKKKSLELTVESHFVSLRLVQSSSPRPYLKNSSLLFPDIYLPYWNCHVRPVWN